MPLPPDQAQLQPGQEGVAILATEGQVSYPVSTQRAMAWIRQADGSVLAVEAAFTDPTAGPGLGARSEFVTSITDTYNANGSITNEIQTFFTDPATGVIDRRTSTSLDMASRPDLDFAGISATVFSSGGPLQQTTRRLLAVDAHVVKSDYHQRIPRQAMGLVPPIWTNVGAPFAVAQIAGTSQGQEGSTWVHLGGSIAGNGGGTFIDNSNNYGYPGPTAQMRFLCDSSLGAATIQVAANGDITYPAGGVIARLDLSNVSWFSA